MLIIDKTQLVLLNTHDSGEKKELIKKEKSSNNFNIMKHEIVKSFNKKKTSMIKNGNKNRKIKLMFKTDNQPISPIPYCPTSSFPE